MDFGSDYTRLLYDNVINFLIINFYLFLSIFWTIASHNQLLIQLTLCVCRINEIIGIISEDFSLINKASRI